MEFKAFKRSQHYRDRPILAVDYGTVRVGLAMFCPNRDPYPLPWGKLSYQSDDKLICDLLGIITEEAVEVVILGIPFYTDGSASEMTERVQRFGEVLQVKLEAEGVEFHCLDETLTSAEAEDIMKKSPRYNFKVDKEEIDALSASIILEEFIKLGG